MERSAVLSKIKKLQGLIVNSNPNEAANARMLADRLIVKYSVTEEELDSLVDHGPLYGEDEKLFTTMGIVGWMQQLALAISKHFDCYIIQEETVPLEGEHEFNYFVYGEDEDVSSIKTAFKAFNNKIDELVLTSCVNKGPIYINSYCEGVVQSIRENIRAYGIDIPQIPRKLKKEEESTKPGLVKSAKETPKEKVAPRSVDVNSQSQIKDIMAYFKGLQDGIHVYLDEILPLDKVQHVGELDQ